MGEVFVYRPRTVYRYRVATAEYLERSYRETEGEAECPPVPTNIPPKDVPYWFLKDPLRKMHLTMKSRLRPVKGL